MALAEVCRPSSAPLADPLGQKQAQEPLSSKLLVVLHTVAGSRFELEADATESVAELKRRLEVHLGIPPLCQKVLVGPLSPADRELLGALGAAEFAGAERPRLAATVVVSLDAASQELEHPAFERREAALLALASLGRRGGEPAFLAVRDRLGDLHSGVRRAAAQALVKMVPRGDDRAVEAVLRLLQERSVDVRCTALQVLAEVAQPGPDGSCVEAAIACLEDGEASVRRVAAQALAEMARGSAAATLIRALCARVEDVNPAVRRAAVRALTEVAGVGDGRAAAVAEVTALLSSPSPDVRRAALQAIAELADRGDERATLAALSCADDAAASVRRAAAQTLNKVAVPGDPRVAAAVAPASGGYPRAGPQSRQELEARYFAILEEVAGQVSRAPPLQWPGVA